MNAAPTDFSLVACLPKNTIAPVVHVDVVPLRPADLLAFIPNDQTRTQENQFRDLVLTFREIFKLSCLLQRLLCGCPVRPATKPPALGTIGEKFIEDECER